MDAVLLFSGQGAQKVGMGKDLYDQYSVAKALIEQADKALGESLSAVMFEGPGEELTRTCNCQPALYVHGLACLAVLKEPVSERSALTVRVRTDCVRRPGSRIWFI